MSKTPNKQLMVRAKEGLRGLWGLAIGATIVYLSILWFIGRVPYIGKLTLFVIGGPIAVGICVLSLSISRKEAVELEQIFSGFKRFGVSFAANLLVSAVVFLASIPSMVVHVSATAFLRPDPALAFVLLLLTLILTVPAVIVALSYSMTFFIIADSQSIGPIQAARKSKAAMEGNRWKLFCLGWRFVGLFLLGLPVIILASLLVPSVSQIVSGATAGILFLWIMPYAAVSHAEFYKDLL